MITTISIGISIFTIAFRVNFIFFAKLIYGIGIIVAIQNVCTRIIWRVYVDDIQLTIVCFFQAFKDIKIVAFYIKVFGIVKIYTLLTAWTKRSIDRRVRQ